MQETVKKEYIEREAAVKRFTFATLDCLGMEPQIRASDAVKAIETIPVADVVEVRHGRWIDSKEDGYPSICSVCKYPVDRFYKTKYCPNCGAKMTEDHHEQKE